MKHDSNLFYFLTAGCNFSHPFLGLCQGIVNSPYTIEMVFDLWLTRNTKMWKGDTASLSVSHIFTSSYVSMSLQVVSMYGNTYTPRLWETPMIVLNGFQAVKDALIGHAEEFCENPVASFIRNIVEGPYGTFCCKYWNIFSRTSCSENRDWYNDCIYS